MNKDTRGAHDADVIVVGSPVAARARDEAMTARLLATLLPQVTHA